MGVRRVGGEGGYVIPVMKLRRRQGDWKDDECNTSNQKKNKTNKQTIINSFKKIEKKKVKRLFS